MSTEYWRKKPRLNRVLQNLAIYRKYYGYKTWDEYLEKEIGTNRLRKFGKYLIPFHQTTESIKSFVLARAKEGISMSTSIWNKTPGLRSAFDYLYKNNFFGKRSWRNYLRSIAIKPVEREKHSRESLKLFVLKELEAGTKSSSEFWISNKRLRAQLRELYRKKFFGHKSWRNYLEKEIGVVAIKKIGQYLLPMKPTRASLKSFVEARIKDGTKMRPADWISTKGLSAVYGYINAKKFFGHRTWENYLIKECGWKKN